MVYGRGRKHHGMVTAMTGFAARGKKEVKRILHVPSRKELRHTRDEIVD